MLKQDSYNMTSPVGKRALPDSLLLKGQVNMNVGYDSILKNKKRMRLERTASAKLQSLATNPNPLSFPNAASSPIALSQLVQGNNLGKELDQRSYGSDSDESFSTTGSDTTRGPGERQRGPRHWKKPEDELLKAAVAKYGAKQWKKIAQNVPGRTHTQCLQRWNKVLRPGLKKGPWTDEEDATLGRLVEGQAQKIRSRDNGWSEVTSSIDWGAIANLIPGRSIKQCRERWSYNLSPEIKKGGWSAEEDRTLLETQKSVGNRWAKIARLLPGRTEHTVKTRFRSIMRAKKREWKTKEDSLLLELHREWGSQWAEIAKYLPGRTKNAVNTRFKILLERSASKGCKPGVETTTPPSKRTDPINATSPAKLTPPLVWNTPAAPAMQLPPFFNKFPVQTGLFPNAASPMTNKGIGALGWNGVGLPSMFPTQPTLNFNNLLAQNMLSNYSLVPNLN